MFYNSPLYTPETNLEIALGSIKFQEDVIKNLRTQIQALRASLIHYGMNEESINNIQYKHLYMNKPTAYILIGVPASGKSTWVNSFNKDGGAVVCSTDNYIEEYAQSKNKTYSEVFQEYIKKATSLMMDDVDYAYSENKDIIWDQTNTNKKSRARKIKQLDGYNKVAVVFKTPDDVELKRRLDSRAGKHIPWNVMNSMIAGFEYPTLDEGFDKIIDAGN